MLQIRICLCVVRVLKTLFWDVMHYHQRRHLICIVRLKKATRQFFFSLFRSEYLFVYTFFLQKLKFNKMLTKQAVYLLLLFSTILNISNATSHLSSSEFSFWKKKETFIKKIGTFTIRDHSKFSIISDSSAIIPKPNVNNGNHTPINCKCGRIIYGKCRILSSQRKKNGCWCVDEENTSNHLI